MKSQEFLCALVEQLTSAQGCYSEKDIATIKSRFEAEGPQFATISLPTLDDILLQGLAGGVLPSFDGWYKKSGYRHPQFLHGLWMRVFSRDGQLLSNPSVRAIRAIRQISRAYKKVFEVCDDVYVEAAKSRFVETDRALSSVRFPRSLDTLTEITQWLFGKAIGESLTEATRYRHGPGAVAEGADTVQRWEFNSISRAAAEHFGVETFRATWHDLQTRPPKFEEIPGRLVAVPKTAVKPRLISIEPSYNQFLQQGLATQLKLAMRAFPVCDITNQDRNKALARIASQEGRLATIDLSEASDRIHYGLVKGMFGFNRAFLDYLDATRSRAISVDGRELLLNKFASMGSALTFPVQTMVFTAIAVYASCVQARNFSRAFVISHLRNEKFGVYGDDIIVPVDLYPILTATLVELGLKVNTDKSFHTGLFRESCGGDYWGGHDVTPVYVRAAMPQSRHDAESLVSWSSTRNQLVERHGYGAATEWIDELISSIVPYPAATHVPVVQTRAGKAKPAGVARVGYLDHESGRWNPDLQRVEVRMLVLDSKRKLAQGTDEAVLFKAVYHESQCDPWGHLVVREALHLTHHGRPVSAKLKHRWVASES